MARMLVGLVLVLVGFAVWLCLRSAAAPPPPAAGGRGEDAVPAVVVAGSGAQDPAGVAAERRQAVVDAPGTTTPTGPGTGSLLVHVVWSDRSPAPGVTVFVQRAISEYARLPVGSYVSDTAGDVRLAELAPGDLRLRCDRGGRIGATVVAGAPCEVTLAVPAGVAVHGLVRERDGGPVAGAAIWLTTPSTDWLGGSVVATSAADGTFALRDVPAGQSLGALVAGHAPSPLLDLETLDTKVEPVRVELVVGEPGGALVGRVTDAAGVGIGGARIAVGKVAGHFDTRTGGGTIETWTPRLGLSGDDGTFAIASIRPGRHPVEAFAPGHGFWRGDCEIVAGQTTTLDVPMPRPMTVTGTVTDGQAVPMAGAIVRAFPVAIAESFLQFGQYDYDSAFGHPVTVADGSGRYRLAGLTPGKVWLYACSGGKRSFDQPQPRAQTVLEGGDGAELRWDPSVGDGHVIAGVVLHRDRVPMDGLFVSATDAGGTRQAVTTDAKGRFRFINLRPQAYDLDVQFWRKPEGAPSLGKREVWPDRGDVELIAAFDAPRQLAPGRVRGVVQDSGGRLRTGKMAVIVSTGRSWRTDVDVDGMAFSCGEVDAGRQQVVVLCNDTPVLFGPWFELAPGEDKDVGTLTTEPGGRARLRLQREAGTEAVTPTVWATLDGQGHGSKIEAGAGVELLFDNLSAGKHRFAAYAEGMASAHASCEVLAGVEVTATMVLRAAVRCEVIAEYGADQQLARMQVTSSTGESFLDFRPEGQGGRPLPMKLQLPIGDYVFAVESGAGQRAQTAFSVTSLAGDQPSVRLRVP